MPPKPKDSNEPDYEQAIKTLSLNETAYLLLRGCDLLPGPNQVNALLRQLARDRLDQLPDKPNHQALRRTDHLHQYL